MMKFFNFPIKSEGWEHIHFVHTPLNLRLTKEAFVDLVQKGATYEEIFNELSSVEAISNMKDYNQQNPHHEHPLCMHAYKVYEYVSEMYEEEDKLAMQVAALFHDSGKPLTQVFKAGRDYASYFMHENVSAHMAASVLLELGFDDEFVYKVCNIIQMHMKIAYGGEEGKRAIYHLLGDEYLWKLYFFHEADTYAKS
jgi:hypothetical protein